MTSVMIVHEIDLVRGAIAAMLSYQQDIDVLAELAPTADAVTAVLAGRPDVVVFHIDRCDVPALALPRRICAEAPQCRLLLVSGQYHPAALRDAVEAGISGFLNADTGPESLVQAIRRLVSGERVIDPMLLGSALRGADSPLTDRQREVLRLAAEGLNSADIGRQLFLAPGTVRNYLSAAIRRTGGRSVLEAAGLARTRGWM